MSSPSTKPIISIKSLDKTYQLDGLSLKILKNINLEIEEGEFVSIIGPSGSGKSTLMHLIGALDTPTKGHIYIRNKNIANMTEKQLAEIRNDEIGFVFQQFNLLPKTSALQNVMLPLLYAKDKKNSEQKAIQMLTKVGLENKLKNTPNQLSGGQQQRVAIARALINNPKIILADEPTGNLDTKTGENIMQTLKDLNKEGKTVIIVTHDSEIASQTKRQIKIKDGIIVDNL